ncbi:platelet-activating factor acetylhydrolase [Gorgonomyces haynaldii]|nr:platelet-activating factor acetylhydrolase [Gorgonomyces haynaldii]
MLYPHLPEYLGEYPVGCADIEPTDSNILVRLYYPSVESEKKLKWLPKASFYAGGYGSFMMVPKVFSYMFSAPIMCLFSKPAGDCPPIHDKTPSKLPVIVFSHGLSGMRTTYSTLCGNLASCGFIVVAMEHGDGSGCITSRGDKVIEYEHPDLTKILKEDREQYLRNWRKSQLAFRRQEIRHALELVKKLDAGVFEQSSNRREASVDWTLFKDRIDHDNMALGATSITLLEEEHPFKCATILDPWMDAVSECKAPQKFHWNTNLKQLVSYYQQPDMPKESQFGIIKGTAHNDVSDFSLLFSLAMRAVRLCGPIDPVVHQVVLLNGLRSTVTRLM